MRNVTSSMQPSVFEAVDIAVTQMIRRIGRLFNSGVRAEVDVLSETQQAAMKAASEAAKVALTASGLYEAEIRSREAIKHRVKTAA